MAEPRKRPMRSSPRAALLLSFLVTATQRFGGGRTTPFLLWTLAWTTQAPQQFFPCSPASLSCAAFFPRAGSRIPLPPHRDSSPVTIHGRRYRHHPELLLYGPAPSVAATSLAVKAADPSPSSSTPDEGKGIGDDIVNSTNDEIMASSLEEDYISTYRVEDAMAAMTTTKMPPEPEPQPQGDMDDNVPPPFRLDRSAIDVFNLPYFKKFQSMDGRSFEQVWEDAIEMASSDAADVRRAFGEMSRSMGVPYTKIRDYYESADLSDKKAMAAAFLRAKYRCDFAECVIDVRTSLEPLLRQDLDDSSSSSSRILDTTFLDPLRLDEDEAFFCFGTLYVRDTMRTIVGLFRDDVDPNKTARTPSTALIGSPGVGLSTTMFLAALAQAQSRPVGYYRRTMACLEGGSFFYMTPEGEGNVRVWFTRNINLKYLSMKGGLTQFSVDVERALTIEQDDYHLFVDGPEVKDRRSDLMCGTYQYYCTSDGFPSYKDEQFDSRLWILDGWTRHEAIEGLRAALGVAEEQAQHAYELCGGRIRSLIRACTDLPIALTMVDQMACSIDPDALELVVLSTNSVDDYPRGLRTLFEARRPTTDPALSDTWKRRMWSCQRVDSMHVLDKVWRWLGSEPFWNAYQRASTNRSWAAANVYWALLFHQRVRVVVRELSPMVQEVCWSAGSAVQALVEFDRPNLYWKPTPSTVHGVDAALVHHGALYVFHCTTLTFNDNFNGDELESTFVAAAREQMSFHRTIVVFITPLGTHYRASEHGVNGTAATSSSSHTLTYQAEKVEATSLESMDDSIRYVIRKLYFENVPSATAASGESSKRSRPNS